MEPHRPRAGRFFRSVTLLGLAAAAVVFGPQVTAASSQSVTFKVDRQSYVSDQPVDQYSPDHSSPDPSNLHADVALGTEAYRSFIHIDLSSVSSAASMQGLILTLNAPSGGVNAVNGTPAFKACLLVRPLPEQLDSANSSSAPQYNCNLASAASHPLGSMAWNFDLADMARHWLDTGNTGAVILPVPADQTSTWQVSFLRSASVAVGLVSSPASSTQPAAPFQPGAVTQPPQQATVPQYPPFIPQQPAVTTVQTPTGSSSAPATHGQEPARVPSVTIGSTTPAPLWFALGVLAGLALAALCVAIFMRWNQRPAPQATGLAPPREVASLRLQAGGTVAVALVSLVAVGFAGAPGQLVSGRSGSETVTANPSTSATGAGAGTSSQAGQGSALSPSGSASSSASQRAQGLQTGGSAAVKRAGGDAPGVTATQVNVGFIYETNLQAAATSFGTTVPNFGDEQAEIHAVVDYINGHGGIAGRQIVPFLVADDQSNFSATQQISICTTLTEDDHVFAVVDFITTFDYGEIYCYQQHHTLLLDEQFMQGDSQLLKDLYPFYWSPGWMDEDAATAAMVDGLYANGYFAPGIKLGVLYRDYPSNQRVIANVLAPRLARIGVQIYDKFGLNADTDIGSFEASVNSAVLRFDTEGVNRVLSISDDGGTLLLFTESAEGQQYHPIYGMSTENDPAYLAGQVPAAQLAGAMGSGWAPVNDVNDAQSSAFPATAAETQCMQIMAGAGQHFPRRIDAERALSYCDAAFFLQRAAAGLGADLTAQAWAAAAGNLGTNFPSYLAYSTRFASGRQYGPSTYRLMKFDSGCTCWQYTSGLRPAPL